MPLNVTWQTASTSKGKTYEICRQAPGSDTCWMCCTAMLWALAKDGARPNMEMIEDLMGMAVQQNPNRLKAVETFLKATTIGKCKMQQLTDEQLQKAQLFEYQNSLGARRTADFGQLRLQASCRSGRNDGLWKR